MRLDVNSFERQTVFLMPTCPLMYLDPDVLASFAGVDTALACQFPAVCHYLVLLEAVSMHTLGKLKKGFKLRKVPSCDPCPEILRLKTK